MSRSRAVSKGVRQSRRNKRRMGLAAHFERRVFCLRLDSRNPFLVAVTMAVTKTACCDLVVQTVIERKSEIDLRRLAGPCHKAASPCPLPALVQSGVSLAKLGCGAKRRLLGDWFAIGVHPPPRRPASLRSARNDSMQASLVSGWFHHLI